MRKSKAGRFFAIMILGCGLTALAYSATTEKPLSAAEKAYLGQLNILKLRHYDNLKESAPAASAISPAGASLPDDKDDDGMADSWETDHGFSPKNPGDAWLDADSDQVVNLFEYQLGSEPRNSSSPAVVTVGPSLADYKDLAAAIDGCQPGSVIRVAKGTYKVNYRTFVPKIVMIQGGWSRDFRRRDLKLYPVTLDGANKNEVLYFSPSGGNPVIILDGLKIIRGQGPMGGLALLAQEGAFMKASLFNCLLLQSRANLNFSGIINFTAWYESSSDLTIANTVIGGNQASGIYAQISNNSLARWRIINSAIFGNQDGGGKNGYGIEAFTLWGGALNARLVNSIVWGNAREALYLRWKIKFSIDHTDFGKVSARFGALCVRGAGNLDVDPAFLDSAHSDYHLKSSSPLINKAINKGLPRTDFEGDKRVIGAAPDIGPDELK